jgi:hypothetical protein
MYATPTPEDLLCQGDIFCGNFVFPFILNPAEEVHLVRGNAVVPAREAPDAWESGTESILLPAHRIDFAVILSNTCDISGEKSPLELVTMGGILPIEKLPNVSKVREQCVRNRLFRYHFLQAREECSLGPSFVHFGLLTQVSLEQLRQFRDHRVLTLSSPYRESLAHRFGEFMSRVAVP